MSQHDYTIANQGFPATRADINNALSAIATNNSGTSAPSTQYAGQFWIDTTSSTWTMYIHDGTDDIQFATIDTSANTVNFIDSELGDNSVTTAKIADGNVTSAKLSYPLTTFSSTGIDDNATSTAITISSGEDVVISKGNLTVNGDGSNNTYLTIDSPTSVDGYLQFSDAGTSKYLIYKDGSANDDFRIYSQTDTAGATDILRYSINGDLRFGTSASERMRIDNSGKVGIGTSTMGGAAGSILTLSGSDASYTQYNRGTSGGGAVGTEGNGLVFYTYSGSLGSETYTKRMSIDSSGKVGIGKTPDDIVTSVGVEFNLNGYGIFTRNTGPSLYINRQVDNGGLILFYQAGIEEGNISVSGTTVSYNGFTGTHWSRFTDNSTPTILKGTVLESLDEMCDWYNLEFDVTTTTQDEDGNDVTETHTEKVPHVLTDSQSVGDVITYNHEGTDVQATIVKEADIKHMKSKVSDTVDAKNVYGVFVAYDLDGEGYNDFYVASVGSFVVRIKQGETVAKGDLLQSNGDGTAKVQTDDNIKSSSFAKVLSTTVIETYDDGSFIVPCSLMC